MLPRFTTIGHANRSLEEFIALLREAEVGVVVDVRAFPRSRSNPVFNQDTLPRALGAVHIGYRHIEALGGRRRKQPVDQDVNAFWRVQSFHNYADYALSDAFGRGLDELVRLGRDRRAAMMCAEAVWWRCHRRIITDYLLFNGHDVAHLMAPGRIEAAIATPGARKTAQGKVVYPAGEAAVLAD